MFSVWIRLDRGQIGSSLARLGLNLFCLIALETTVPMNSPAASTFSIDSILFFAPSNDPIGSDSFTISRPTTELGQISGVAARPTTKSVSGDRATVRLADLLDAFKACMANELVWIEDFSEDQIEISQDLHEVLEVFAQIRRQDVGEN